MNNEENIVTGKTISEIILIDRYYLNLRDNRIRTLINVMLGKLNLGNVHAQVIVDERDKLLVMITSNISNLSRGVVITEDLNDDKAISVGKKTKKTMFIDSVNNAILNINKKQNQMEQKNKTMALEASKNDRDDIVQELTKIIVLSDSGIISTLLKYVNLSEVCHKMTNGAIDNIIIEDHVYTFINNSGISQTFNSTGHSDEEINYAISSCILFMIDFSETVKPLDEASEVVETTKTAPIQSADSKKKQITNYNKEVQKALDSLDKELDDKSERGWSQGLRGILLKCAHRAGFEELSKASIENHVRQMTFENKERLRDLYQMYGRMTPAYIDYLPQNKTKTKHLKTV